MKKYKFPQFLVEIIDPTILVKKVSVPNVAEPFVNIDVHLIMNDIPFGVLLENVPCEDIYTADFMDLAIEKLEEFIEND